MSCDNVEIVRAMLGAIGPDTDTDAWLDDFFNPEVEWHDVPIYPTAGVHSGREAVRRHAAEPLTGGLQNPATGAVFVTHAEALEAVGLSEQQRG
jgi:hypothetical protein